MSNWRLTSFRGQPEVWCFDLGNIKRFNPFSIPDNDAEPLSAIDGFAEIEDGVFHYGMLKEVIVRVMGFNSICRDWGKGGEHPILNIPDDAEPGYKIDPKGFYKEVVYRGKSLHSYCNDPRLLAITIFQRETIASEIPYKKVRRVFEEVPTREAALKYLQINGFTWDEPLTDYELSRIPDEKLYPVLNKVSDPTPLFEGLER